MNGLWIALGVGAAGALGALLRVLLDDAWLAWAARRTQARAAVESAGAPAADGSRGQSRGNAARLRALAAWPWPLLVVNVMGALVLGFSSAALPATSVLAPLIGAGFCGGLTTFSTWAVLMADATLQRRWWRAASVLCAHVLLGLLAALLGHALGTALA